MKNYILKYEEFVNENIRPDQIEKVSKDLAYSMSNHTKPDSNGNFSAEQVQKAFKYFPDLKYVKDKNDIQTIVDKVLSIVNESENLDEAVISTGVSEIDSIIKQFSKYKDSITLTQKPDHVSLKVKDVNGGFDIFSIQPNGKIRLQSGSWSHGEITSKEAIQKLNWSLVNQIYAKKPVKDGETITFAGIKFKSTDGKLFVTS